ncbi:acyltransferase family protein [Cohnella abietis]|uniref:O-acetyltransferase n=1 Tax=Cohnella abietis TaxID=2507935 RepID=A0A3T1D932_9BACL|nr:acyltransferase family protein [Cohnella abietis]BBI34607.1 O-acetyltransferase [Cohnella abietis]
MNVAKGIGIIAVVIGHSTTNINLLNFIYLFHMPLFFFVSGYFYKDKNTLSPWEFFKKKVTGLYVPFITFELISLVLHNAFLNWGIYTSQMTNNYSIQEFIAIAQQILSFNHTQIMTFTFWFFPSLFFSSMMFLMINMVANKAGRYSEVCKLIMVVAISAAGFILIKHNIVLSWSLRTSMVAIVLFYCGYLFKRFEDKIKSNIGIAIFCAVVLLFNMVKRVDMSTDVYINPVFFYMNALMGIYLIIFISKFICRKYGSLNFLNYCGKKTIIIMATQYLGLYYGRMITSYIEANIYSKMQVSSVIVSNTWVIVALCGLFVPLAIQYIIDRLVTLKMNARKQAITLKV